MPPRPPQRRDDELGIVGVVLHHQGAQGMLPIPGNLTAPPAAGFVVSSEGSTVHHARSLYAGASPLRRSLPMLPLPRQARGVAASPTPPA